MAEQDIIDKIDDVMDKVDGLEAKIEEVQAELAEPKSVQKICMHCVGTGMKATIGAPISCPDCGGNGVVPRNRMTKLTEE